MNEGIEKEKENELDFIEIINNIKNDVINTRNKILCNANSELINLYFRIGRTISEKSSYGKKFVGMLSISLKLNFPDTTGFSERNLWRMKAFYEEYKNYKILPLAVAELPWTHNYILLEKVKDIKERVWYAKECINNGWSKTILIHQIELKLYNRKKLSNKMTNFNEKLELTSNSKLANEIIKDPYIFELEGLKDNYKEIELENRMMAKIKNVLLELGKGFSFIGNQYKISTDKCDYYLDMLFYHLDLHCYVVVELKNTYFKPEYVMQLAFYVKAVDSIIKK